MNEIPSRCIDPVMKYCQGCRYGHCIFLNGLKHMKTYTVAVMTHIVRLDMTRADPKTSPQTKN